MSKTIGPVNKPQVNQQVQTSSLSQPVNKVDQGSKTFQLFKSLTKRLTSALGASSLSRTKNIQKELSIAKKAKKIFYSNNKTISIKGNQTTFKSAIFSQSSFSKATTDNLIYLLAEKVDSKKLTSDEAKELLIHFLENSDKEDYQLPEKSLDSTSEKSELENDKKAYNEVIADLNSNLGNKLSVTSMVVLGLSRGIVSKKGALILLRLSEGVKVIAKVLVIIGAILGGLTALSIAIAPPVLIATIAAVVVVLATVYIASAVMESKLENANTSLSDILNDDTDKVKARDEYNEAMKAAKQEVKKGSVHKMRLHKLTYWIMMMVNGLLSMKTAIDS